MLCQPTGLVRRCKRLGYARTEKVLRETIDLAKRKGAVTDAEFAEVNIDTTVRERAVKYPTDGVLVETVCRMLVRAAIRDDITVKQIGYRVSHGARVVLLRRPQIAPS